MQHLHQIIKHRETLKGDRQSETRDSIQHHC
jgi:hypothetical protein